MVRHILDWPTVSEKTAFRSDTERISTLVTLLPGSQRYLIITVTRDADDRISHISTTISNWTSYL